MNKDEIKFAYLRDEMVKKQIEARRIIDPNVLNAMRKIPRHQFVSEALMDQSYGDFPLPIGEQQTISQPYIVAEMTQALELGKDDRVLEIGTGSGYQTAILAEIAYKVFTIERIHNLLLKARKIFDKIKCHNIVTKYSDGTVGWEEESPFDAIVVTAGAPKIPGSLIDQLAIGGRMVIPVGDESTQDLVKIVKTEDGIQKLSLGGCRFVKLIGELGWKN